MTETTIAWTDNNGSNGFSSDDLQFRFITGRSGGVNNLATPDDLDGLHIARFTSNGRIGFGNTFGLNATGMTPTVPYVAPQNLLHMSLSGNQPVFLQITNRDNAGGSSGTGETANDGLYLGLPATTICRVFLAIEKTTASCLEPMKPIILVQASVCESCT